MAKKLYTLDYFPLSRGRHPYHMPLPLSHLIPGQELPPSLVSPLNHPTRALPALFTCVPLFFSQIIHRFPPSHCHLGNIVATSLRELTLFLRCILPTIIFCNVFIFPLNDFLQHWFQ
jgi:hypothetical protein